MQRFFERAILMVPMGGLIGLWTELFLLGGNVHDYHSPLKGTFGGAMAATVLCVGFRNVEFSKQAKKIAIGLTVGMVVGLFVGGFVVANRRLSATLAEMALKEPGAYQFVMRSTAKSSFVADYQYEGILWGLPLVPDGRPAAPVYIYCRRTGFE